MSILNNEGCLLVCSLCHIGLFSPIHALPCGHVFHLRCIEWLRTFPKCPECKVKWNVENKDSKLLYFNAKQEFNMEDHPKLHSDIQNLQHLAFLQFQEQEKFNATLQRFTELKKQYETLESTLANLHLPNAITFEINQLKVYAKELKKKSLACESQHQELVMSIQQMSQKNSDDLESIESLESQLTSETQAASYYYQKCLACLPSKPSVSSLPLPSHSTPKATSSTSMPSLPLPRPPVPPSLPPSLIRHHRVDGFIPTSKTPSLKQTSLKDFFSSTSSDKPSGN
ncbi:hypothetical protein HMI54_002905 [Coelomomyces lativittatus]|nr:hypothetical protein HMI56_003482 [Coelomomyces lativittatus]KAJ1516457.1 hypothetical protein HMI55_002219 [Coelomomyces lativittatus]KAJ1518044.1 hypothetical protein HMI54_002905 [Coelomomyces lativittatus]